MKKKVVLSLITATMLASVPLDVYAVGSASINFRSNDSVEIGDNIKVYMSIEDIKEANNGIVGVGGKLIFDNEKLELIDAKTIDTPYDFWFNPESNKLAGLDFTFAKAINNDTNIYEFTFKAIETGSTNITLEASELSDNKNNVLNSNVYGKSITITEKQEEANEIMEETEPVIENKTIKLETNQIEKPAETNLEETNKDKLAKMSGAVHNLLKKITEIF